MPIGEADRGWLPVLPEARARQAEAAAIEIAASVATMMDRCLPDLQAQLDQPDQRVDVGQAACLAAGMAGSSLLDGYLAVADACGLALNDDVESVHRRLRACLAYAAHAAAVWPMRPGLFVGFTGIAWVIAHLNQRLGRPEAGLTGGVDAALLDWLNKPSDDVDLIRGVTGVGVYSLERLPSAFGQACIGKVVDHLACTAEETMAGLAWRTPPRLLAPEARRTWPDGRFDVGMAHGAAGVVAFLARAQTSGVAPPATRALLEGGSRWLAAQRLDTAAASAFPAFAPAVKGGTAAGCRPGWCYGDPGVAAALLAAGQTLGDTALVEDAVRVAVDCTVNAQAGAYPSRGVGLCHGVAGIAHTVNAMYQATGDVRLLQACRWWLAELLRTCRLGDLIGGPGPQDSAAAQPSDGWDAACGLLTGAVGVALALLAASSAIRPGWDAVFLVGPGRRPRGG